MSEVDQRSAAVGDGAGRAPADRRQDREPRTRLRTALGVAVVGVLAALLGAVAFDGLRGSAYDGLLRARDAGRPTSDRVLVVEVDAGAVNRAGGLPLPRSLYARAIDRLDAAGAAVVAVDVQFTEPSSSRADNRLVWAIEDAEVPVVLATSEVVPEARQTDVLGGKPTLDPIGAEAAHASLALAPDGRWRTTERSIDGLATFADAASRAAGGPRVPAGGALLDPAVPAKRLERVTLDQLLAGEVDRSQITGRVAVIGVTYVGAAGDDRGLVAGSVDLQFGVHVHAQAIDTTLRGSPLVSATWLSWLLAISAILLTAGATLLRAAWRHLAVLVGAALVVTVGAVIAARLGGLVDALPASFALLAGGVAGIGARATIERTRRAQARASLARFVPPAVVDELLAEGSDGRLAPQLQQATVVFCDLRGYTALVSHLPRPEALAEILDAYLGEVTATIHAHGGTVVSFQGDGVMSAFGAPVATDQAPLQAIDAARALLQEALPRITARMAELVPAAPAPALGIGVASGPVLAGTVGPPARREYAVVGSPTNLAARLQAQSKLEHTPVVIDGATARAAGADHASHTGVRPSGGALRLLGEREIRGLERPVECWTLAATS